MCNKLSVKYRVKFGRLENTKVAITSQLVCLSAVECRLVASMFARGIYTRTAVARLPLRQLGFLVIN